MHFQIAAKLISAVSTVHGIHQIITTHFSLYLMLLKLILILFALMSLEVPYNSLLNSYFLSTMYHFDYRVCHLNFVESHWIVQFREFITLDSQSQAARYATALAITNLLGHLVSYSLKVA